MPPPHLPGAHNWQNAALAYAATKPYVKDARAIAAAIADFPGLAHRIEDVGRIGKVRFVNDSKATNADAAERGAGLLSRHLLDRRRPAQGRRHRAAGAASSPRIRKAYLIGEAANDFAATLEGKVAYEICRHAGKRAGRRRRRRRALAGRRARRPAVAGLRLVRPVPRFRAARRRLPRSGRQACGATRPGGVMNLSRANSSDIADWWWTVDRLALVAMLALIAIG